jgi:hypothetical protein
MLIKYDQFCKKTRRVLISNVRRLGQKGTNGAALKNFYILFMGPGYVMGFKELMYLWGDARRYRAALLGGRSTPTGGCTRGRRSGTPATW